MRKELHCYTGLLPITINGSPLYLSVDKEAKRLFIYTEKNSKFFSSLVANKKHNLVSVSLAILTENTVVGLYNEWSTHPFAKVTKKENPDESIGVVHVYKSLKDGTVCIYIENCDIEYYSK